MNVCSVTCVRLCEPMDSNPPGSSVYGILQGRKMEWIAITSPGNLPNSGTEPTSPSFSSVQLLSCIHLFATPWTAARQASLSITNSWSLPKFMSIESVMPSNHLILCHPLLLPPSVFPRIRVFSNESALLIRWPKYWSFSFNISPSNEHAEVISFRMDWLDLLAVQRTLQSLLQHHGSKPSILWGLAGRFFTTEPSEKPPYISYILSISFLCKNKQRYPNHWVWCTISSSFLQYLLNWNP